MNIEGHAFKSNEKELMEKRAARYAEILYLRDQLQIQKSPQYGRTNFSGVLPSDEARALSEEDLALLADNGNLCFGGSCTKCGDKFSGLYWID